jgi:RNA polymerase sigma-54 factor
MPIELNQQLQPTLQLRVTPKQIAANAILAMSSVELTAAIATELEENPALEMVEQSNCPICGSVVTGSHCTECLPRGTAGSGPAEVPDVPGSEWAARDESEDLDPIARAEAEFTLAEHLLWSLHALLPRRLRDVADYAIGALDENGFLTESDEAIAAATDATPEDVAEVREAMRGIEPIGVGSRNVAESLLAQLAYLRESGEAAVPAIAEAVIGEHLEELGERRFSQIASALGVSSDDVVAAWEFVKANLHPYPAAAFHAAASVSGRPIIRPDVLIRVVDGELEVEVVESRRFSLRLDGTYARLSAGMRRAEASEADRRHVREYVGRARFFIDNVNRRRATLQRIAECLVERQHDYLVHGVQHLVPLTRAEVGALIGMHESTVSRATAEKYVMLPTGEVVPFGHFFTASLGIKDQIRKMIDAEATARPLSDQQIADQLADDGVAIARRTVAKYRDELQLLPARLRRR